MLGAAGFHLVWKYPSVGAGLMIGMDGSVLYSKCTRIKIRLAHLLHPGDNGRCHSFSSGALCPVWCCIINFLNSLKTLCPILDAPNYWSQSNRTDELIEWHDMSCRNDENPPILARWFVAFSLIGPFLHKADIWGLTRLCSLHPVKLSLYLWTELKSLDRPEKEPR